jgi:hypothetical protein
MEGTTAEAVRRVGVAPLTRRCRASMVSRTSANATTGRGGRTASEAGLRSDTDEQPGLTENSAGRVGGCRGETVDG